MTSSRAWKIAGIALAALLVAHPAEAARRRHRPAQPVAVTKPYPPVWIVRDEDSELVLFGSVHILPPRLGWEPPALTSALKTADDIWFELPIDPRTAAETSRLAQARGLLAPHQSLFKILPLEDAGRLSRVAQAYQVSPALLDRLQPWLAEVALAEGAYRRAGASASGGVEQVLAAAAPASADRRAFETPAEQIDMLAGSDMRDQIASLRQTLVEMETKPDEFAVLIKAWQAGDLAALDREALQPLRSASPRLFRRLVSERNARWADALSGRLAGRGRTVVIVGMGHLIGPDGVPARLRALGYKVIGP